MPRKTPRQKPHESEQSVGTPREFLHAIEGRFGPIVIDLAATAGNAVVPEYFGPGSPYGEDSLQQNWVRRGLSYLNPEFGYIPPWAKKAAVEGALGAQVALLVPASLGSDWYVDHVKDRAMVLILKPRLTFVGHSDQYPKDLMLCLFGPRWFGGVFHWYWDAEIQPQLPRRPESKILEMGALLAAA